MTKLRIGDIYLYNENVGVVTSTTPIILAINTGEDVVVESSYPLIPISTASQVIEQFSEGIIKNVKDR